MKITPRTYAKALVTVLDGSQNSAETVRNFLSLLQRKKQFKLLPKILIAFEKEWNTRRGVIKMEISYPEKFKDSLVHLQESLEKKLEKKIEFTTKPDNALIGGFRLKMEDTLIDASVAGALHKLTHTLS